MFDFSQVLMDGWTAGAVLGVPLLIIAGVAGFLFALFQAVTQIQDQALPQIVKILLVLFAIAVFGGVLSKPLLAYSERVFSGGMML